MQCFFRGGEAQYLFPLTRWVSRSVTSQAVPAAKGKNGLTLAPNATLGDTAGRESKLTPPFRLSAEKFRELHFARKLDVKARDAAVFSAVEEFSVVLGRCP